MFPLRSECEDEARSHTMAEYDVAIRGGRIIDGTENPWFHADLGVKDGRIVRIGRVDPSAAARVIDAG